VGGVGFALGPTRLFQMQRKCLGGLEDSGGKKQKKDRLNTTRRSSSPGNTQIFFGKFLWMGEGGGGVKGDQTKKGRVRGRSKHFPPLKPEKARSPQTVDW